MLYGKFGPKAANFAVTIYAGGGRPRTHPSNAWSLALPLPATQRGGGSLSLIVTALRLPRPSLKKKRLCHVSGHHPTNTHHPGTHKFGLAMSALSTPRSPRDFANFATMTEEELSESLIYLTCPICEQVRPCRDPCHAAGPSLRESFSLFAPRRSSLRSRSSRRATTLFAAGASGSASHPAWAPAPSAAGRSSPAICRQIRWRPICSRR